MGSSIGSAGRGVLRSRAGLLGALTRRETGGGGNNENSNNNNNDDDDDDNGSKTMQMTTGCCGATSGAGGQIESRPRSADRGSGRNSGAGERALSGLVERPLVATLGLGGSRNSTRLESLSTVSQCACAGEGLEPIGLHENVQNMK